ncbi:Regulatory protein PchR [Marinibacterium anthonyi]|nr:Regulatory protein PchR [Marinibacterium anthonyi]
MSLDRFPGNLRIGVLNERVHGVANPAPQVILPKFQIMIILEGEQKFYLDDHLHHLDATRHPVAFMMRIAHPTTLRYGGAWGDPYRKIALATPDDWFDRIELSASDDRPPGRAGPILSHGFDTRSWTPSAEIVRLTEQIIAPPPEESEADRGLFRFSRGVEIMRRAMSEAVRARAAIATPADPRPEDLRLYILSHLNEPLGLDQLESHFHLNRRSLQRMFKQRFGVTLSDFIRQERLKSACRALQDGGTSIARAAHLAGYTSAANFTTAFRREFGVPPGAMRKLAI